MVARPVPLVVALLLALASLDGAASEARAQRRVVPGAPLPTADLRIRPQRMPEAGSFQATMLVSGLFGALGTVGGLYAGASLGAAGDEDIDALLAGAFVGDWVGAGFGGAVVSRQPARAFLGAALGILPGLAILRAADGGGGVVLAFVAQGVVTALVTRFGD
ncbi:MAG: hypothetical protein AB7T31_14970 [Gemmatimonadales bacterium]